MINMEKFVCLFLVAVIPFGAARSARDVGLGYRYSPDHSSAGADFLHSPSSVPSTSGFGPSSLGSSYFKAASLSSYGGAGSSGFVPSTDLAFFGNSGLNGGLISNVDFAGISSSLPNHAEAVSLEHQTPIVTKHFYIHSAPEDHNEQEIVRYVNVGRPQKNYRVVFIDAPSSSASKAKIIANVAPVEDKTAIYVLTKKSNALDVNTEVVTQPSVHHKPEVFFIKYKTQAEADHAKHIIQSKYDGLGGSTNVSNEEVVPVSSVIGSLGSTDSASDTDSLHTSVSTDNGNIGTAGENVGANIISSGDTPQQTYLPAHQK